MHEDKTIKYEVFDYVRNVSFQFFIIRNEEYESMDYSKFLPHWHPELELAFINSSSIHYIDGVKIEAHTGDLVITNSMSIHKITVPCWSEGNPEDIAAIVIIIHPDWVKSLFPEYGRYVFTNDNIHASPAMVEIIDQLQDVILNWNRYEGIVYLKSSSLLASLFYELSKNRLKDTSFNHVTKMDSSISKIKEIIRWINSNYASDLTVEAAADSVAMSVAYFCHFFKKHTGMTFHQYLTKIRVIAASRLLIETDASILDIALASGFSDNRRLSIAFKQEMNCSPSIYRKNVRKDN